MTSDRSTRATLPSVGRSENVWLESPSHEEVYNNAPRFKWYSLRNTRVSPLRASLSLRFRTYIGRILTEPMANEATWSVRIGIAMSWSREAAYRGAVGQECASVCLRFWSAYSQNWEERPWYALEILEEIFGLWGYYDTVIFERFETVIVKCMAVLMRNKVRIRQNCQSIDTLQVL